jgi:hypothetical protein
VDEFVALMENDPTDPFGDKADAAEFDKTLTYVYREVKVANQEGKPEISVWVAMANFYSSTKEDVFTELELNKFDLLCGVRSSMESAKNLVEILEMEDHFQHTNWAMSEDWLKPRYEIYEIKTDSTGKVIM